MRWFLAALLFALAVTLAIATAAIRSDSIRARRRIERDYRAIQDRVVELRRWQQLRIEAAAPGRLAELHWRELEAERSRRQERAEAVQ
ncbi:MAG: hypothetical protein AB8H80_16485 [Planctomycetota bacterium]